MKVDIKKLRKKFLLLYKDTLDQNRQLNLKAKGMSMLPFIRQGDEALIRRCLANEIKIGDLVLFKKDGTGDEIPAVHRVIRKRLSQNILITKGDSCLWPDKPLRTDDLLGRVVGIKKKNTLINLNNPSGKCINILFWLLSITYILPVIIKIIFLLKHPLFGEQS